MDLLLNASSSWGDWRLLWFGRVTVPERSGSSSDGKDGWSLATENSKLPCVGPVARDVGRRSDGSQVYQSTGLLVYQSPMYQSTSLPCTSLPVYQSPISQSPSLPSTTLPSTNLPVYRLVHWLCKIMADLFD